MDPRTETRMAQIEEVEAPAGLKKIKMAAHAGYPAKGTEIPNVRSHDYYVRIHQSQYCERRMVYLIYKIDKLTLVVRRRISEIGKRVALGPRQRETFDAQLEKRQRLCDMLGYDPCHGRLTTNGSGTHAITQDSVRFEVKGAYRFAHGEVVTCVGINGRTIKLRHADGKVRDHTYATLCRQLASGMATIEEIGSGQK